MNKRKSDKELEVDFIGGEELTKQEDAELSKFFAKKKEQRSKGVLTAIRKKKEPA
jgi:hypothetical protein